MRRWLTGSIPHCATGNRSSRAFALPIGARKCRQSRRSKLVGDVMRRTAFALAAFLSLLFASDAALAERRVALVIGNSAYQNAPQLSNPSKDSAAISEMLRKANFEIVQ